MIKLEQPVGPASTESVVRATTKQAKETPAAAKKTGTQAIERALAVLFAFTQERPVRRVTELSKQLGMNKSTVYRLLQALEARGLLRGDEDSGTYRLGPSILDLSSRFLSTLDLRTEARPFIEQLARDHGESVNLAVIENADAISIDNAVGTNTLQVVSRMGLRIPIYCSAAGKALILDHSDDAVRRLMAGVAFTKLTKRTIRDVESFIRRLQTWRVQGWALNDEESETGMRAISAPVRDHSGTIVASISISAPTFRVSESRIPVLAEAALETAGRVSSALGAGAAPRKR